MTLSCANNYKPTYDEHCSADQALVWQAWVQRMLRMVMVSHTASSDSLPCNQALLSAHLEKQICSCSVPVMFPPLCLLHTNLSIPPCAPSLTMPCSSYETTSLWPLLESPPEGLHISFVKAEGSNFRYCSL